MLIMIPFTYSCIFLIFHTYIKEIALHLLIPSCAFKDQFPNKPFVP